MKQLNFAKMTAAQREASYLIPKARTIPVFQVALSLVVINTSCVSLVVYGTFLGNMMGMSFTNFIRSSLYITPIMQEILVGILLGDGSIRRPSPKSNPLVSFKQGLIHLEYILWISSQLSPIRSQMPALRQRRDLTFYLDIHSRSLPCLIPLHNLFIHNNVKIITMDLAE
jgi:hypothetical protein